MENKKFSKLSTVLFYNVKNEFLPKQKSCPGIGFPVVGCKRAMELFSTNQASVKPLSISRWFKGRTRTTTLILSDEVIGNNWKINRSQNDKYEGWQKKTLKNSEA